MNVKPSMSIPSPQASRPLAPGEVALIGTVHMDRGSFRPLRDLMVAMAPGAIATEMSQFGIRFRQTHGRSIRTVIRRHLRRSGIPWHAAADLSVMLLLLSFPFEYLAARLAARRLEVPLANLGRDRDSTAWLGRLARDQWSDDRLAMLAGTGRDLRAELEGALRSVAQRDPSVFHPGPRDRVYARRIEEEAAAGRGIAVVMGWQHVVPGVSGNTAWILHRRIPRTLVVISGKVRLFC